MENTLPRKATAGLRTFLSTGKQRAVLIKSAIHVKTAEPVRSDSTPSQNHLQGGEWTHSVSTDGLLTRPVLIHIVSPRSLGVCRWDAVHGKPTRTRSRSHNRSGHQHGMNSNPKPMSKRAAQIGAIYSQNYPHP